MVLRDLQSLKKIPSLRDLAESPLDTRFSAELIQQWNTFVSTLSRTYCIPDRISSDDLRQELWTHTWRLTRRVDPVSRPVDFVRQLRSELRNKCIDINRYFKARKRTGRTGRAVQCLCCGSVTRLSDSDPLVCRFCGELSKVREVETYARNMSLADTDEPHMEHILDDRSTQPIESMIEEELIERVRNSLPETDRQIYGLMVSPSTEFLKFLQVEGYEGDHRTAPNRAYARFMGIAERIVSDAHVRIKQAVSFVCQD